MKEKIKETILELQEKTESFSQEFTDLNPNIVSLYANQIFFKSYPRFQKIKLNKPKKRKLDFINSLENRKTDREFNSKNGLELDEISFILYYSFGIKQENHEDYNLTNRFYPSAGARYPIEAYIYLNKHNEIKEGLYHYNVKEHSLEYLNKTISNSDLKKINSQKIISDAPMTIFLTFVHTRTSNKYGPRSFRLLYQDCGHLSQNILLISSALKLKVCPFGGFDDNLVNNILDLKVDEEFINYIISIGK